MYTKWLVVYWHMQLIDCKNQEKQGNIVDECQMEASDPEIDNFERFHY